MPATEFELIARYFTALGAARDDVLLGVGDDAALLDCGGGEALAVCVDTLNGGVHFPEAAPAEGVGHKALAVNLSDLAAMGAEPAWALLALSLPAPDADWLAGFRQGLAALAEDHGVALVGGDTTRGALAATVTALGRVPAAQVLRRGGARPGDLIYVTGSLGDAAAGLRLLQAGRGARDEDAAALVRRLHYPEPRVTAGLALRGLATAAIDVSDGLAQDLGHLLAASGVGARVELTALPLSPALRRACSPAEALAFAIGGGDDYELCFTASPTATVDAARLGVAVTRIGVVEAEGGLRLLGPDGRIVSAPSRGYDHFAGGGG